MRNIDVIFFLTKLLKTFWRGRFADHGKEINQSTCYRTALVAIIARDFCCEKKKTDILKQKLSPNVSLPKYENLNSQFIAYSRFCFQMMSKLQGFTLLLQLISLSSDWGVSSNR